MAVDGAGAGAGRHVQFAVGLEYQTLNREAWDGESLQSMG